MDEGDRLLGKGASWASLSLQVPSQEPIECTKKQFPTKLIAYKTLKMIVYINSLAYKIRVETSMQGILIIFTPNSPPGLLPDLPTS